MKKITLFLSLCLICLTASAQFVAEMEVKEPIEGLCSPEKVYALFPMMEGQVEAVSPISKDEILKRLNSEVQFLKTNPKYKGKGMIGLVINCEGELVQCRMDNKTKSPELDKQIEAVFATFKSWKPGKLNKKTVNSTLLYSFKIKKGEFTFD